MITAAFGILAASLLGSVHCAAMCGGFVCLYAGSAQPNAVPLRSHALYNVGRLVSYLLLGALAGTLGAGITQVGSFAGVGRAATVVAGVLMIGWAVSMIAAQQGLRIGFGTSAVPLWWQRGIGRLLHAIRQQPTAVRAALTGLGTTLLPCGWLYVFVASAGGTGNARDGMLVMAVFWLGTVPALLAVGVGAQRIFGPFRRKLPTLGAVTVLVMGVLSVTGRLAMNVDPSSHRHEPRPAATTAPASMAPDTARSNPTLSPAVESLHHVH
jgi:sulfite exporter TauE/SafE